MINGFAACDQESWRSYLYGTKVLHWNEKNISYSRNIPKNLKNSKILSRKATFIESYFIMNFLFWRHAHGLCFRESWLGSGPRGITVPKCYEINFHNCDNFHTLIFSDCGIFFNSGICESSLFHWFIYGWNLVVYKWKIIALNFLIIHTGKFNHSGPPALAELPGLANSRESRKRNLL